MAYISAQTQFNADAMKEPIIGIASELAQHDSGEHLHQKGQLLFAKSGTMRITLNNEMSILAPQRVAWIPPYCQHRVTLNEVVGYRSIYIDTHVFSHLPKKHTIWSSTPLLQAVLEKIALSNWGSPWQSSSRERNWLNVLWDEIEDATIESMQLIYPQDSRLAKLLLFTLPPPLQELTQYIGASEKTITRIFQKETGLNYQAWRQQWRLLKAIELLHSTATLAQIAEALGFANDSAFAAFFKKMTGLSTRQY